MKPFVLFLAPFLEAFGDRFGIILVYLFHVFFDPVSDAIFMKIEVDFDDFWWSKTQPLKIVKVVFSLEREHHFHSSGASKNLTKIVPGSCPRKDHHFQSKTMTLGGPKESKTAS